MNLPKAYTKRRVNPDWIHYWKLAHSKHTEAIFVASFITPEPYQTILMLP